MNALNLFEYISLSTGKRLEEKDQFGPLGVDNIGTVRSWQN